MLKNKPPGKKQNEIGDSAIPKKKPPFEQPKEAKAPSNLKPRKLDHPLGYKSSLPKSWFKFYLYNDKCVLAGLHSQTHKKFRLKTNGQQGACNSLVACIISKMYKMETWSPDFIDRILVFGDGLLEKSKSLCGNPNVGVIEIPKIHPTFYLNRNLITFQYADPMDTWCFETKVNQDQVKSAQVVLEAFFSNQSHGVMKVDNRHMGVWKYGPAFFLFDPTEHQENGEKWKGIISTGFAICVRFTKLRNMAQFIVRDNFKGKTMKGKIWSVKMLRCEQLELKPPRNLEEVEPLKSKIPGPVKHTSKIPTKKDKPKEAATGSKEPPEPTTGQLKEKEITIIEELSPESDLFQEKFQTKKRPPIAKIPLDPHRLVRGFLHFTTIDNDKGILRGTTHQMDKKFSRFRDGEQSLSQAVAALVMRRCHFPTRDWIRKYVNDILKLGETIHHKSLKEKAPKGTMDSLADYSEGPFKLYNVMKKIDHSPGTYTLNFEELALLGKLDSDNDTVLELLPALMTFLRTYDCCIVNGPLIQAVWTEDNKYFLYDPNERNAEGKVLIKAKEGGVACVMWFNSLKDLVKLYIENTPKDKRRDDFYLSKVLVEDYVGLPDNWNNFQALDENRWILRGTLSQSSNIFPAESRNTQCTANAAMSIAFVHIKEPENWTKHTMDQVLQSGDEYYRATTERLKAANSFYSNMLQAEELNRQFSFSNKEIKFDVVDCHVNGAIGYPDKGDVLNIKMGLKKFFEDFDFGILTCRHLSVAIWKILDSYYYFDSHNRDEKGRSAEYGVSCLIRSNNVETLAMTVETNLRPNHFPYFNISGVKIQILDADEEAGTIKQPLYNFTAMGDEGDIAILTARTSNKDKKYEFNAGKQTTPMCIAGMAMNRLRPSKKWDKDLLQEILDVGHKFFEDCMAKNQQEEKKAAVSSPDVAQEDQEENVDKGITFRNLASHFKIGINKFEITTETVAEGFVEDGLENALTDYYTQNEEIRDDDKLELLVETEDITVAVWKDANLYYIFDPYPRDANGQVIGKEEWSIISDVATGATATSGAASTEVASAGAGGGGDAGGDDMSEEIFKRPRSAGEGVLEDDPVDTTDEDANGKACILFFYKLEDVVQHILENTKPNRRSMMPFSLVKINMQNTPMTKQFYQDGMGHRKDDYSGDWYGFVELDHGQWILRGEVDLTNSMFPEKNRGKQELGTLITSLAFAKLYSMSKMTPRNITSILQYGDRLLTQTKRKRKEELKKNIRLNLLEEEIRAIVENEKYELEAFPNVFVIGNWKIQTTIAKDKVSGDLSAKDDSKSVSNLKHALKEFFETHTFGILECQGYAVAVWKGVNIIYMFDPHKTDVTGVSAPIGFPCITRYLNVEKLSEIYSQSVPKEGHKAFRIHAIEIQAEKFKRPEEKADEEAEKLERISAFVELSPGLFILRGSLAQDNHKFGHGLYTLNAPIAFVALTMSLLHKSNTWSKPIVDEVIYVANDLFDQTVHRAGNDFNPWENAMEPQMVANDFMVGIHHANCQLRLTEQRGIMETKDPRTLNLRQGLERFFKENTHGILYSPPNVCYAIWEEECCKGEQVMYFFDPNKRGPKGLPSSIGTACVMTFMTPKIAYDHILGNLDELEERKNEFRIIPVEIVVGPHKTSSKKKLTKDKKKIPHRKEIKTLHDISGSKKLARQKTLEEKKASVKKVLEMKMAEAKKRYWLGRTGFYPLPKGELILRGTRCLTSSCYQDKTRGYQGIPVCIVAFVAHHIVPISDWTYKELDAVMDTGDQLYIDSYIAYSPRDKYLGLENVLRDIFIMNKKAHVTIYKPISIHGFHLKELTRNFEKWFLDHNFCMLNYMNQWVAIFLKGGYYYLFDPHPRGPTGCWKGEGKDMAACLMRFDRSTDMTMKLMNNLKANVMMQFSEHDIYDLVLVKMAGGVCQCDGKNENEK